MSMYIKGRMSTVSVTRENELLRTRVSALETRALEQERTIEALREHLEKVVRVTEAAVNKVFHGVQGNKAFISETFSAV